MQKIRKKLLSGYRRKPRTDRRMDSDHFIGLRVYGGQKTILFQYLLISKRKNKM